MTTSLENLLPMATQHAHGGRPAGRTYHLKSNGLAALTG